MTDETRATAFPTRRVEIVPDRLHAVVATGAVPNVVEGSISCWHYLSQGLRTVGQKEVWVTIKQVPDEPMPPREGFVLFRALYDQATKGTPFDVGHVMLWGGSFPGFFGRPDLRGVTFVPLEPASEKFLPGPTIGALLMTEAEAQAALEFGILRLMGALGSRWRHFPTVTWNDRNRPEMPVTLKDFARSLLGRMAHAWVADLFIELRSPRADTRPAPTPRIEGDLIVDRYADATIVIDLDRTARPRLARFISDLDASPSPQQPFALVGDPDPTAGAALTWPESADRREIIGYRGHDNHRISATFVGFVPHTKEANNAGMSEDGFAVVLAPPEWQRLRTALGSGDDVTIPLAGDISALQIRWRS